MTGLKYGLIGAGMMGQEHIRNIAHLGAGEIIVFVEPDPHMTAMSQAMLPHARRYSSIEALLSHDDLDCLVIASPNHCHAAQLQDIAAKRPLPILLEKPACVNEAELDMLAKLDLHYPAPIWVAMEYRYMPAIADFCSKVHQVTGGIKMLSIREHRFPFLSKVNDWNRFNHNTGGTFVEKCCHFFDLMRFILGANPVDTVASMGQAVNHLDECYEGKVPDILDHGYVIVTFDNNARALLELCMFAEGSEYQETMTAIGASGKLECFVPGPARFWPSHLGPLPQSKLTASHRHPRKIETWQAALDPALLDLGDHNGATFFQHQKFARMIQEQGKAEVTLEDGLWAVRMGLNAQKAAHG